MPSDPNPNMDKLLRDYAKRRREAASAPFEIHAATRKMLQGEVSRTLGQTTVHAQTGGASFSIWPKLIWGGAIAAAVAITLFWLSPALTPTKSNSLRLASAKQREEEPKRSRTLSPQAPSPAPAAAADSIRDAESRSITANGGKQADVLQLSEDGKARTFADEQLDAKANKKLEDNAVVVTGTVAPVPVPSAAPAAAPAFKSKEKSSIAGTDLAGLSKSSPARARSTPSAAAESSNRPLASSNTLAERESDKDASTQGKRFAATAAAQPAEASAPTGSAGIAQTFQQQDLRKNYRLNLQSPPQPTVLTNFQIVWNGSHLKVIDADGSIYEGTVQPSAPAKVQLETPRQTTIDRLDTRAGIKSSTVTFRVVGQNRTLNREIVFTGTNLITPEITTFGGIAVAQKEDLTKAETFDRKKAEAKKTAPTQNLIQGVVNIGGTNQFPIQAVETP